MNATRGDIALHVYGLVEADSPTLPKLRGRQDGLVRRVRHGPIDALVSELDTTARLGRKDLLAHAHVLEHVAARQSVLPMRFGVIARDEEELRKQLPQVSEWAALLRRFAGLVQVSVDAAHLEGEAIRELIRRDPRLLDLRDDQELGPDDVRTHARRVQLGELIFHGLEALRLEDGALLHERLAPLAHAMAVHTAQGQVFGASFLVERKRRSVFDAAVARVQQELPRIELHYVGPQPPWSFIEQPAAAGEPTWAS